MKTLVLGWIVLTAVCALIAGCSSDTHLRREPPVPPAVNLPTPGPAASSTAPPVPASSGGPNEARVQALQGALRQYSFERVLCPEDIEEATVRFTHFADEKDAFDDDYYVTTGRGVVLGVQDSQYVIFTTRCAVDFTWPNHDVRWRAIHGYEEGPPELRSEGLIIHGASRTKEDEFFIYGTTDLYFPPPRSEHGTPDKFEQEAGRRRRILAEARKVGDLVTIDEFKNERGDLSDVALVYVPFHRESTVELSHLGLSKPKDAVRELLKNQGTLFGMEFEFSCRECQQIIAEHQSRETQAFALGFGLGLVTGAALEGMLQRLLEVDRLPAIADGKIPVRLDPTRRIANAGLRRLILERDRFTCVYAKYGMCEPSTCWACVAKNMHIDHVVPFSLGGLTLPENMVAACAACNMSKGSELLGQWLRQSR